jgi:two-component system chemotaxis sensor kinase CheA
MSALLDSLGQGFFVFDQDGLCHDFSSKACETVLEGRPNKRPVWDVLKLPENKVDGFKKWLMTIYAEMLPFEDLACLGPPTFPHSGDKHIQLEYFPLLNEGKIEGIVVVASDVTSLLQARKEAETERENAKLIINLISKKQQISRFVNETRLVLKDLERALAPAPAAWDSEEIFRALHTVKGGCASFNLLATTKVTHEAENLLSRYKDDPSADAAARLREQCVLVDQEFQRFLTETTAILGPAAFSSERFIEMPVAELRRLCSTLSHWTKGGELADGLLRRYIMEPVGSFFEPYADVIQSVAEAEGKKVLPHEMKNADLGVVPEVYSSLFATLVHAYRNAVDHGIESPSVREERGKKPEGKISTSFSRESSHLVIRITDDGNGIDPAKIRARLTSRGIAHEHETDEQVVQHVFDSSFSTRDQITETSGRGVGMDAIKIVAENMGGKCVVQTKLGQGTVLTVTVPWSEDAPLETGLKAA